MSDLVLLDVTVSGERLAVGRIVDGRNIDGGSLCEGDHQALIKPWLTAEKAENVHVRLRPLLESDLEPALELAVGLGWLGITVGLVPPRRRSAAGALSRGRAMAKEPSTLNQGNALPSAGAPDTWSW